MHIVLLNDDSLPAAQGGAASVVARLEQGYVRAGHRVTLVTTHQDPALDPILRSEGRVSIFSHYPMKERHRHCLGSPAMRTALGEVFAALKPDAVHANNVHAHLTYESVRIAKNYTDRVVLTAHDVFLVAFRRVAGERFERLALQGCPMRMHWWEHLSSVGRKYWPLRNMVIRRILNESQTKVVAISEVQRKFLAINGINVAAVIHNGTEVQSPISPEETAAFRKRHGLTGPTVLFGGRLSEDKGVSVLLAAFRHVRERCPQAKLLIVGDTARIAEVLPGDRSSIVCPGWLSHDDMRIAYSASTVVTTPSLCFDPFNLMNIEAMAEGKPVVATSTGGAPEIIVDGVTGFTLNPRDISAFSSALLTLLQDTATAERMGRSAREHVERNFSIDKQCAAYLRLLDR
ncbi:glycosyltransferase family 4 protein [Candidatus Peregrinibacteria bacterium]|nr:glycosyltransferase family 4 protein [Candidatus Peregrinibacteria bacterium]